MAWAASSCPLSASRPSICFSSLCTWHKRRPSMSVLSAQPSVAIAHSVLTRHSVWKTSIRFTLLTTLLFGLGYPLLVTGIAGIVFPHKAAGSLIMKDGQVIGSQLLAQSFTTDRYFHPRPSAAGNGYDATSSGG